MRQALIISFLLSCYATGICQTGKLTGIVMDADNKTPLDLATVSVLEMDSSLITYKLSDKTGTFSVERLPLKKKILVRVTYTGYMPYQAAIQLEAGKVENLAVFLSLNVKDSGVTVTANIPVRMNGDTLEINPAAFKMKQDAVIEELLNQVSGIIIWSDGSITVNGKKVQSLLVDGKPFLGQTDNRIATQNLPKSAIEKIQLYQEYDRTKIGLDAQPQDSLLTMNIKLKEGAKKGYFGKGGGGYGTRERFEADLSLQMYNKQSSLGIGGGINNINKNIGNIQEMFQNNTFRNFNPNLYNVGRFGASGINKNHSIGAVLSHNFIETANSRQNNRITINYNKSGTDAFITDLNLENRTALANPQFSRGEGVNVNRNDKHDVGINYLKTNSYNDELNLNGTVSTNNSRGNSTNRTEVRDSIGQLINTNDGITRQKSNSDNESLTMRFAKANTEYPARNFNIQVNARRSNTESERNVINDFRSFTDASKNAFHDRKYNTNNNLINLTGTLDYTGFKRLLLRRYNLFGINILFNQRFNYSRNADNSQVNDYDSSAKQYVANSNLSNRNENEKIEYSPSLGLSKYFFKFSNERFRTFTAQFRVYNDFKTDNNTSTIAQRNLKRNFQFFRYDGNVNYSFSRREKNRAFANLTYAKDYEYPTIDMLYTIVDDITVYNIRIGNPNLKNRINHSFNVNGNYNSENPKSPYSISINFNGRYTRSLNQVTDSSINDISGKRFSYFVQPGKSSNKGFGLTANLARKIKSSSVQLIYTSQFNTSKLPNYVDSKFNISESENFTNNLTFQFALRSVLVVSLEQSISNYKSSQSAAGLRSFSNKNISTKLGVVLNYPANFSFSSTIENIDNSNLDKPTVLWNSFATFRFMKQQGELKFSAMDLLKQYKNITNSATSLGTTTRITNGLQQYFLLTFSYFPRKFGKTEIKRPEVSRPAISF